MKEKLTIIFTNDEVVPYMEGYPTIWVCPKNRFNHYCNLYGGLNYEGLTGFWHREYYKKGQLQLPKGKERLGGEHI